jgi:hypothetical protein
LIWTTAHEINNHHFTVEKSKDGLAFNAIGDVLPSLQNNYSFTDKNPFNKNNYYRIKQVDVDGKFSYSKIINISTDERPYLNLLVSPNPARNSCTVQIPDPKNEYSLLIINSKGQIMDRMKSVAGNKNMLINLVSYPSGSYWFKLVNSKMPSVIFVRKLVKIR